MASQYYWRNKKREAEADDDQKRVLSEAAKLRAEAAKRRQMAPTTRGRTRTRTFGY